MKKMVLAGLIVALTGIAVPASAAIDWDDMSWWGNTGATPDPVEDLCGRSGSWWRPVEPASNVDDAELWGNRGVVYYKYTKAEPPAPEERAAPAPPAPPAPAAPAPEAPKVQRTAIILNNVLFGFDQSTLSAQGKAEIDKLAGEMKKYPKDTVVIEGHTCSVGEDAYNMGLGQRRADAVKAYMVQTGIDAGRIQAVSYGEGRPAVANDTAANRALNRRAEFKISLVD